MHDIIISYIYNINQPTNLKLRPVASICRLLSRDDLISKLHYNYVDIALYSFKLEPPPKKLRNCFLYSTGGYEICYIAGEF